MSAPLRKGWCPGALRPMAAADGLVVRLRLTGGILPVETALALADIASRHGNGKLDLTSRANLQMRGVAEAAMPALLDGLHGLGLVDADAAAEAVRNVIASPLAGLHEGLDIRPIVAALEARLSRTPALHGLPHKFGFLVDDGSVPSLADVAADVRFDWCAKARVFAIGLVGTRADAVPAGVCAAAVLADRAETIARGALAGFARVTDARRMRALIAALGADEVLRLCGCQAAPGLLRSARDDGAEVAARQLGAPYGRLAADMLRVAAGLADAGFGELRLTPWRSLLLPGVAGPDAGDRARRAGWIVDATDPRLAVAACVGAPDCERASVHTRAAADALADLAATLGPTSPALHVSGCAKGCAHAGAAPVVLVGRDGLWDLVRNGRAGDRPIRRGLDLAAARAAIAALQPR